MRFPYQAGKSSLIVMTARVGINAGTTKRWGLYDGNNGIFFSHNGTTLQVGKRKNAGIITSVDRADWNLDVMDGTGPSQSNPSGINLDETKTLIYFFDLEWLGVGRVRMGVFVGGIPYYVHELLHSNIESSVYI